MQCLLARHVMKRMDIDGAADLTYISVWHARLLFTPSAEFFAIQIHHVQRVSGIVCQRCRPTGHTNHGIEGMYEDAVSAQVPVGQQRNDNRGIKQDVA